MIPTFLHNLNPRHDANPKNQKFFSESKAWEWVAKCRAFCFNGNNATAEELAYNIAHCQPGTLNGFSLVTYQHVNGFEPHPTDGVELGKQFAKLKDRIQFLSDHVPTMDWAFLECELWAKYRESHRVEVLKRHADVIEFIRNKFNRINIAAYKYGSFVPRDWWLDIGEDTVYPLGGKLLDAWSVPFYFPADLMTCRRCLDATVAKGQQYGHHGGVVPWISIGQQYIPGDSKWTLLPSNYDLECSRALGQLINKAAYRNPAVSLARGHWGQIPVAYVYAPHNRNFEKHFDAYAGGAL